MDAERPPIVVLAGPTASGKSACAMALAERYGAEIVGADSVQVYRGFDIGSAKPTERERGTVRHHLVDVIDPTEAIDAARYATLADEAIADIHARGGRALVVGGTGLWLRALVRGLVDLPEVDAELRARLEAEADGLGHAAMHERLRAVDPLSADTIHPNDTLRVVRALEVHAQTGQPLGELRRAHAQGAPRYPTLFVALEVDMESLTRRIESRLEQMFDAGFVDEVRGLLREWPRSARAFGSVGYREVVEHLVDGLAEDEMRRRARKATRLYARRQRNWFRAERAVDWRPTREEVLAPEGVARVGAHWGAL